MSDVPSLYSLCESRREHRRIHLRLAAELLDAFGDLIRVLLFVLRVLEEFVTYGLRVNPRRHEVVKLVAQDADELRRQRLVEDGHRLVAIELVVLGHRAVGDVLASALANFLKLCNVASSKSPAGWPAVAEENRCKLSVQPRERTGRC